MFISQRLEVQAYRTPLLYFVVWRLSLEQSLTIIPTGKSGASAVFDRSTTDSSRQKIPTRKVWPIPGSRMMPESLPPAEARKAMLRLAPLNHPLPWQYHPVPSRTVGPENRAGGVNWPRSAQSTAPCGLRFWVHGQNRRHSHGIVPFHATRKYDNANFPVPTGETSCTPLERALCQRSRQKWLFDPRPSLARHLEPEKIRYEDKRYLFSATKLSHFTQTQP